eukprot:s205_g46.t1
MASAHAGGFVDVLCRVPEGLENANKGFGMARHEMHCGPAFCILVCLHIWSMRVFGFHADCFERTEIS